MSSTCAAVWHLKAIPFPTQYPPTNHPQFSMQALLAFDKVLDEASKAGVKVIPTFAGNYNMSAKSDTKAGYAEWAGLGDVDDFYNSTKARQMFKDHIKAMVTRRNSINGRLYSEDPTILAWDLMNEPICAPRGCESWIQVRLGSNPTERLQELSFWFFVFCFLFFVSQV